MKQVIRLEEAAMTAAALFGLSQHNLGIPAWVWFFIFFLPDVGMLGYLVNERIGAVTYNLFHHKGIAIVVAAVGHFLHNEWLIATGLLLFAHSSFDRMLGYGLKYFSGFRYTHLETLHAKA